MAKKSTKKEPVAYLGVEKIKQKGKDKPGTILAYPESPRTDSFDWTPLYK